VSTGEASRGGLGQSGAGEVCLEPALRFGQFGKDNFFGRNTTQLPSEAEFGQRPDQPLCRIDLPRLHAVAVVMLKFVMIIMVPLAKGHDRHEPPVACAAFGRIRAVADIVAKRIDAESAVLENDNACDARDEKSAEGRRPTSPGEAEHRREQERDQRGDPVDVAMLPHDERILLQVRYIVERRERVDFE